MTTPQLLALIDQTVSEYEKFRLMPALAKVDDSCRPTHDIVNCWHSHTPRGEALVHDRAEMASVPARTLAP